MEFSDFVKAVGNGNETIKRIPGSDIRDPYSLILKPKNVPVWDKPPVSPEEEALYGGVHIHSESNPLGLHTHIKGGKLAGAHTHGPNNRNGSHFHAKELPKHGGVTLDGGHVHDAKNHPDGCHEHQPANFG